MGVALISSRLAAHRKGSKDLRVAEAGGSAASLAASYAVQASTHRKKISDADGELSGAITCARKGGMGIAFVKYDREGVASFAALRETGVLMALIVAQHGHSTSLIVRIDLGENLTGVAEVPKPVRPKYSRVGLSKSPPTFEI